MLPTETPPPNPWRKRLLALEFLALAVLLVSMSMLGNQSGDSSPLNPAWLLIPAVASLLVFLSFIGLMYLRWVVAAEPGRSARHKLTFALLALTLLGVWAYSIARTWVSITAG